MAGMRSQHSFYPRTDRTVRSVEGAHADSQSMDRVAVNIDRYENTSAAAIAVALEEVNGFGRLNSGDAVLWDAFRAGFAWGAGGMAW
jgi:3-oxoacyl-[acyl-carrier-protein] synthase III